MGQRNKACFSSTVRSNNRRHSIYLLALLSVAAAALILSAGSASASKQAIAYFGTENDLGTGTLGGEFSNATDIAVNGSGAGPADKGDIYVIDRSRIQRFAQDDNGTPSNPYDDTFSFVSAWGAGVDSQLPGDGYETCTVAANCAAGVKSGTSGALGEAGAGGITVDQDTGVVYVTDTENNRISAYEGDGTFLRSFGWDVIQSGPDDAGTGYEVCVAADGDQCKAGSSGSGAGQLKQGLGLATSQPDGDPATGTLYVADSNNHRVNTYNLDGSSPGSFGSTTYFSDPSPSPEFIAVDSRGIVYAAVRSNNSEIARYDSLNANGSGVGFLAPISSPPLSTINSQRKGLEVDPDSDGAGPDADVLYVLRDGASGTTVVQQFGPSNAPGLLAPPNAQDDAHGLIAGFSFVGGLGLDTSSGRLFISTQYKIGQPASNAAPELKVGVYVLDNAKSTTPSASVDSISDITATSATIHLTIDPHGPPLVGYSLEYSSDGLSWKSMPETVVGTQESAQSITTLLDSPPSGLEPTTLYHVRLKVSKRFTPSFFTPELTFTTASAPPMAETTGAPIRTSSSAQLGGRVNARNSAATYFFEYGDEGPCDSNPCAQTAAQSAGSGPFTQLVSEEIEGLEASTTYHYRIVIDNGQLGSPVLGNDMTLTTRGAEARLTHGHFSGPPGSDRAWELVSAPESGGNPVESEAMVSDNGDRAVWGLGGGSPDTETGAFNLLFSERTSSGWQTKKILPPRAQIPGPIWFVGSGPSDLSKFSARSYGGGKPFAVFRLGPGLPAEKLGEVQHELEFGIFDPMSDDGSRVLMAADAPGGPHEIKQIFDITTAGDPQPASLLPDNTLPACGVPAVVAGSTSPYNLVVTAPRASHQLSADGRFLFFPSAGNNCSSQPKLYLRDFVTQKSKLISGPVISGPSCGAGFISSTPKAAFFWTKARLSPEDTTAKGCSDGSTNGDVYRYGIGDGSMKCVTCVISGGNADVDVGGDSAMRSIAIPADGSRVYFQSASRLLPGARPGGAYRVDVENGSLAYIGKAQPGAIGIADSISPDGSTLIFSSSDASLNPLGGGAGNAGSKQLYRYNDDDHSLICLSCPQDGSVPRGDAIAPGAAGTLNTMPLSRDGIFAFSTPTPLVPADQNTAAPGHDPVGGTDVYEWRDGKLLLVSDGLTNWQGANSAPFVKGMTPSGRDIFFNAAIQYTPDARDDFLRLYDARIGGGIEFPKPPPPCPLEVCQGIPVGAPEEAVPGTSSFAGPGNVKEAQQSKHKKHRARKHHRKAAKKHAKHQANHNRRSAR
jgi:sugar lactone lactonase YvrE